jgi:sulfonate transport system permease protein
MSLASMTATVEQAEAESAAANRSWTRGGRVFLGLLLPVGLAVAWEIAVRMGLSSGRLVPPPSVISSPLPVNCSDMFW